MPATAKTQKKKQREQTINHSACIQKEIYTNAKNKTGIEDALITALKAESAQYEKAQEAAKDTPDTRVLK